jgi:hypothetical protein
VIFFVICAKKKQKMTGTEFKEHYSRRHTKYDMPVYQEKQHGNTALRQSTAPAKKKSGEQRFHVVHDHTYFSSPFFLFEAT